MGGVHSRPQDVAKVFAQLAKYGISVDPDMVEQAVDNTAERRALAQEAMLKTLALKPPKIIQRKCDECGAVFGTNYLYVGYCGDPCRKKALKKIGIDYNPMRNSYEASRREEPMIIPPEAIEALRRMLSVVVSPTVLTVETNDPVHPVIPGQGTLFDFEPVPTAPNTLESDLDYLHQKLGVAHEPPQKKKSQQSVTNLLSELDQELAALGI